MRSIGTEQAGEKRLQGQEKQLPEMKLEGF
jgi:hypothetical protein